MSTLYGQLLDVATYNGVEQLFPAVPKGDARDAFIVGWSGVGSRMRSLDRHLRAFELAMGVPSMGRAFDEVLAARLEQKEHLFGVVVNGQAAIENCCYMAYGLHLTSTAEVTDKQLKKDYRSQVNAMGADPKFVGIASVFKEAINSGQWKILEELRDAMMHRGCIPLVHQLTIGGGQEYKIALVENPKSLPTHWKASMAYDPGCLRCLADWVANTVSTGLLKTEQYLQQATP